MRCSSLKPVLTVKFLFADQSPNEKDHFACVCITVFTIAPITYKHFARYFPIHK